MNSLEILGPADAFENEEVKFTITLNGEPVQARVSFGDGLYELYSNSTTGYVTFITPSVPYTDQKFTITASYLGELIAYHSLLVKNSTDILKIELSTDYVIETEEFTVTILDRENPVNNANVWFNSKLYQTDIEGKITLLAPDVLITTNYGISVNKTGYKSKSSMITINNDKRGLLLMDVIYPYIVESGQEDVKISITGEKGGIMDVRIRLFYENEILDEYLTDLNGNVFIKAPQINNDNYFTIIVEKDGYSTYYSDEEYIIILFIRDFTSDLDINVDPSEVIEGEPITVTVTNEIGVGVPDVSVWRGADLFDNPTDSEGILTFSAPSVFMDREYYLFALKEGYNYATKSITIRDRSESSNQLIIESENTINESEYFSVFVKDSDNILLPNALVTFNSEQKLTNGHGMVDFIAPNITSNSFYQIDAVKSGYHPASRSIEIIHIHDENCTNEKKLKICFEPYVLENNKFIVTIRDGLGFLISDASVTFKDTTLRTDEQGQATFNAPNVGWDQIHKISVTKTGFKSTSSEVVIKNIEGFVYWPIVFIAAFIIIIGVFAFYKFRYNF